MTVRGHHHAFLGVRHGRLQIHIAFPNVPSASDMIAIPLGPECQCARAMSTMIVTGADQRSNTLVQVIAGANRISDHYRSQVFWTTRTLVTRALRGVECDLGVAVSSRRRAS